MADRLKELKKKVFDANMKLSGSGLVIATFGNVSGIDRTAQIVAIKPSGIEYTAALQVLGESRIVIQIMLLPLLKRR